MGHIVKRGELETRNMLKDETFFESDLFLSRGLIAITPPHYRNERSLAKIEPQTPSGMEVKTHSQLP